MKYEQGLQRNIKLEYVTNFFTGLHFSIPIWVAFYLRYLNFSQLAMITVVQQGLNILLELPTGALADLIGRKRTIVFGFFMNAVGFAIVAIGKSFPVFMFAAILESIGNTLVSGADSALSYDTFKELKKEDDIPQFHAKAGFIYRIALTVGSFFGGYLFVINRSLPYFMVSLSFFVSAMIFLWVTEPKIDSEKFTLQNYIRQTKLGFRELLKSRHTQSVAILYLLIGGITWACLTYFNQPFAVDSGFKEVEMSWLFTWSYLMTSIMLLFLSKKKKFLSRTFSYVGIPILMAIGLAPGFIMPKYLVWLFIPIVQIAGSSRFAFLDRYVNQEFESKYRATALSSLNMLVSLFMMMIIGTSGFFQDAYGARSIYSVLGLISLFVVIPWGIQTIKQHKNHHTGAVSPIVQAIGTQ